MNIGPVFQLPAQLTHDQAATVAQQLGSLARTQTSLRVDASVLQQFDSSALAVLLTGLREAAQQQHALTVSGLPAKALALARVYGVQDLLELQA
ncbi:MAG: STAS domain-containing protein [Betaproteobacteria bacterium]|nr:STAS domain-containing protein [Betaproteobacteria bacterium]